VLGSEYRHIENLHVTKTLLRHLAGTFSKNSCSHWPRIPMQLKSACSRRDPDLHYIDPVELTSHELEALSHAPQFLPLLELPSVLSNLCSSRSH
jgi:hypothetical protein